MGEGPPPKPDGQRVRRNAVLAPMTILPFKAGTQPPLPLDRDWHPVTEQWWKTWGESTLSQHMTQVDWNFLLMTAVMVDRVWTKGSIDAASEVRIREQAFGATIHARLRLRISFREADEMGAPEVRVSEDAGRARFGPGSLRAVGG